MMHKGQIKIATFVLCVVAVLMSCAAPPRRANMIPSLDASAFIRSKKTLRVVEVKGGEKWNPSGSFLYDQTKIDSESFEYALIKILENSRMFKHLSKDQSGDCELYTEIVSQQTLPSGYLAATTSLLVNYRLIDTKEAREVWTENIFSQYAAQGAPFTEGIPGAVLKANEGAVRDNLIQLLGKVSKLLTN